MRPKELIMRSDMSTTVHARGSRGALTRRDVIRSSLAGLAGATAAAMLPLKSVLAQSSPSPAAPFTADQRAVAERILQREVDNGTVPGIGWSIGDERVTLAEGGVGLRVVSPAMPVGVATRFAIASVSKQFTAACIFLLRDQG